MTAPPGLAPNQEAAPEHIGRAGILPRQVRDEVAHRFMAEFGMTGATAVRYAKAMLAAGSLSEFIAPEPPRRVIDMTRAELARLMAELPLGLPRAKKAARPGNDYRPRDNDGRLMTA